MTTWSVLRSGVRRYAFVLALPEARTLLFGGFIARIEVGGLGLAIILLVHHSTGSIGRGGVAAGAFFLFAAGSQPVQGRLMDRIGRVQTLRVVITAHLCLILVFAVLGAHRLTQSLAILLAAGVGATLPALTSYIRVAWSGVTAGPKLGTVYALDSVVYELALVMGPLLVSLVITVSTAPVALAVLGSLGFAGGVLVTRVKTAEESKAVRSAGRSGGVLGAGVAYLVAIQASVGLGLGAVSVAVPTLAERAGALNLSGPLLSGFWAASLVGGLWYGAHYWRGPPRRRLIACLAWSALGLLMFSVVPSLYGKGIALILAGFAVGPGLTAVLSLVPLVTPNSRLTEAFSWVSFSEPMGVALGSWASGALLGAVGLGVVLWIPPVGDAIGALLGTLGWSALGVDVVRRR